MATTFKVATLIIKTLVKPIANQLKKNAVHEGPFRDSCHWLGQVSNTVLTHVQLRSMGHKVKKIKPLPTDDAVKAGADLFAEAMVLTTGMLAIGVEVLRKARSDAAAAEKKIQDEIIARERKELKLAEKERLLREQLHRLETRMVEVENTKFALLHEKLLHEQQKHLMVTENLLKRIHYLEHQLNITTPYPLLPSHRPPSHPSNLGNNGNNNNTNNNNNNGTSTALQNATKVLDDVNKEQQSSTGGLYQTMREQTNKLFSYSSFFQTDNTTTNNNNTTKDNTNDDNNNTTIGNGNNGLVLAGEGSIVHTHAAEEDLLHNLLDTTLPEMYTKIPVQDPCIPILDDVAYNAADLVVESSILPEEEIGEIVINDDDNVKFQNGINNNKPIPSVLTTTQLDDINTIDPSDALVAMDKYVGNVVQNVQTNNDNHPHKPEPKLIDQIPPPRPVPPHKEHLTVRVVH